MPALKISKKRSAELIGQLNHLYTQHKVDAVDRTAVAELAFAELIAGTLPACSGDQSPATFYRSTLLDGVKDFLDQLVEVVQINQEQCLLAVWGCYSYRMRIANPQNAGDVRPCVKAYAEKLAQRHADVLVKYHDIGHNYYGLASIIYAN